MKIIVYGLGIIGASLCASLKRAGHEVYGKNRSRASVEYALSHGYIDGEAESYDGADVIFLALPPAITLLELTDGNFPKNAIVSDICGVKAPLEQAVKRAGRSYRYVSIHPMAGKETSGIESASADLFDGANLLLIKNEGTDETAAKTVLSLAEDMRFGKIVTCTAREHDEMIAFTSQLAHVVSNAYVKSSLTERCEGFTGGSFQDMTRIAGVDEDVWTELYFFNREALLPQLGRLIADLQRYQSALEKGDEAEMRSLLKEGKEYRRKFSLRK